ncbi:MAG: TolC family protein [Terracidiphilus sp.]
MDVKEAGQFTRRLSMGMVCAAVMGIAVTACAQDQNQNPSSTANAFYGSVTVRAISDEPLKLSMDDAIRRGLETNLGLREAESGEKEFQGEKNEALQEFLPTINLSGGTGVYQHNLAALGFGPGVLGQFSGLFPGGLPPGLSLITKDDLTQGQLSLNQTLFSGVVIAGWKAAGAAARSAYFQKMSARGEVVQQVASTYLRAIADASEVDNARALVKADEVAWQHAHDAHAAGTMANLDELRARVELQSQQQTVIVAQNEEEKDLILLKREIGIDSGQKIILTDPAPYSDLAEETPAEVRAVAYKNRQDYQNLQNQVIEVRAVHNAYRAQRLPSLSFSGYYGVDKVNGTPSHGVFDAMGTLNIPIFREASIRGEVDASGAQLAAVNAQLDNLRSQIDQQVRSALLDVEAAKKLVEVSKSNVDLAVQTVSDETDRVNAGVDDNLPLVTAQSSLASAQTDYVRSLYQYNLSKLALARSAGVIEQQYRAYLGR